MARAAGKYFSSGALVLGYHRIADVAWDPLNLVVGIENFRRQVEYLSRIRQVVSLGELVRLQQAGRPMEKYAALTFDDGYGDFRELACPVLREARAPATVFVATGFTGDAFWWEQIVELLDPRNSSDGTLTLDFGEGGSRSFENLDGTEGATLAARNICHQLRAGNQQQISAILQQLRAWAGSRNSTDVCARPLEAGEIESLFAEGLVEIGAHTVSHGCLGEMAPADQQKEIERSRIALESVTRGTVSTFSYPNGSYSRETPEIVRRAGFRSACSSRQASFRSRDDCFLVPRIWAPNVGQRGFEVLLSKWVRIPP
jgi:peptidoglycan/xylan/chitin deacetylase (PgdA/CDA1 family)